MHSNSKQLVLLIAAMPLCTCFTSISVRACYAYSTCFGSHKCRAFSKAEDCLQGENQCPRTCKKNRRHPKSKHGSFHQTRGAQGAMQRAQLQRTYFWPHRRKFINQRSASAPSLGQSRDSLCNLNTWSLPALRSQTGCNVVDTSAVTNADFNSTIQISPSNHSTSFVKPFDSCILGYEAMTLGVDSKVTVPNSGGTSHTDLVVFHAHLKVLTHPEIFATASKVSTCFDVSNMDVQVHQVHQTD